MQDVSDAFLLQMIAFVMAFLSLATLLLSVFDIAASDR
jgi:hypothetical protein